MTELLCLSGTFSDFDGGMRCDCRSHVSGRFFTDSQCIDGQPQRGGGGIAQFTCMGKLVAVSAISVALADPGLPKEERAILPGHLEDIVAGPHPSLSDS